MVWGGRTRSTRLYWTDLTSKKCWVPGVNTNFERPQKSRSISEPIGIRWCFCKSTHERSLEIGRTSGIKLQEESFLLILSNQWKLRRTEKFFFSKIQLLCRLIRYESRVFRSDCFLHDVHQLESRRLIRGKFFHVFVRNGKIKKDRPKT